MLYGPSPFAFLLLVIEHCNNHINTCGLYIRETKIDVSSIDAKISFLVPPNCIVKKYPLLVRKRLE